MDEEFGTPEEKIEPAPREWEACMTFNGLSWGYIDSEQALPYSYNAQQILRMLARVTSGGGNLLLNVGPTPDGSVPQEAFTPMRTVGAWLNKYGECMYGHKESNSFTSNRLCSISLDGNTAYVWNWIWPRTGELVLGGFQTKLKSARLLGGTAVDFTQDTRRIVLRGLPDRSPDETAGVAVFALEFEKPPVCVRASAYPALNGGQTFLPSFE
jgi:alpha-L-fucosidase